MHCWVYFLSFKPDRSLKSLEMRGEWARRNLWNKERTSLMCGVTAGSEWPSSHLVVTSGRRVRILRVNSPNRNKAKGNVIYFFYVAEWTSWNSAQARCMGWRSIPRSEHALMRCSPRCGRGGVPPRAAQMGGLLSFWGSLHWSRQAVPSTPRTCARRVRGTFRLPAAPGIRVFVHSAGPRWDATNIAETKSSLIIG